MQNNSALRGECRTREYTDLSPFHSENCAQKIAARLKTALTSKTGLGTLSLAPVLKPNEACSPFLRWVSAGDYCSLLRAAVALLIYIAQETDCRNSPRSSYMTSQWSYKNFLQSSSKYTCLSKHVSKMLHACPQLILAPCLQ